ncbi:MAG: hypothetical protein MRK02_04235 [Candidatus Scalindua sp.]|nr:hypothetical protein [Candidatus Scalindua sp.]
MAHQKEYMLSGLERELELYMGEEFESGTKTLPVKNTEGDDVNISLQIDESTKTGSITVSAYTTKDGTQVPVSTIKFRDVKKVDEKTVLGMADEVEGHRNVLLKMQVDTAIPPKLIATPGKADPFLGKFIAIPGKQRIYTIIGQEAQTKADDLAAFIKNLRLDQELEYEYEKGSPTNVYEKIVTKVDYIIDSSLTRKPLRNTPVEITFDYDLRRKRLTMSAKQLDIQYIYDVKDFQRLKSNSNATRIEGEAKKGYSLFEILDTDMNDKSKPATLSIGVFSTPSGASTMLKNDRYILEQTEAQKLKNMFLALLENSQIELLNLDKTKELEFELEDIEKSDEFAYEYEYEDDDDSEDEFELENELNTLEDDGVTENFARRLYELSTRSYESEYELDEEVDRALDAVEDEFMVKRLHRKKKRGKKKGLFKKILSAGAKIVGKIASKTPIGSLIKAGTSLVRGNIKGALGNLAKAAVGTVLGPVAGTVATTAIDALGGGDEGGEEGEVRRGGKRRRAIRRVARIARDTYREVADTLPEDFDHPLVASEVARKAVRKAMIKNGVKPPGKAEGISQQRRVIKLRPGEKVVIIGS